MNSFLRHTVATLAFRFRKAVKHAPAGFGDVRAGGRSATETVAHMGDLFDWALRLCEDVPEWREAKPQGWAAECERFLTTLAAFDRRLQEPLNCKAERLFQGPIADALTHVGQLGTLRRVAGSPVGPKNYFKAEITAGTV